MDLFNRLLGIPNDHPVLLLAPMEGITNSIYRNQLLECGGIDVVATEFVRITSERQRVQPFVRHQVPLQIQVMASAPEVLKECILFLKEKQLLYDSDWLDLNVGCPSRRVNAHGAGAALLREPSKIVQLTEMMRESHPGPLSLKTRLGYETSEDFPTIMKALTRCPLDFITIHARSRCGAYHEPIHLDALALAVRELPFPVIGNGEVRTVADAMLMQRTGVRGIMCGRGSLIDPLLFQKLAIALRAVRPPADLMERQTALPLLKRFALQLIESYRGAERPGRSYVGTYKEFSQWFSRNDLVGRSYFDAIKRLETLEAMKHCTISHFAKLEE